MMIRKFFLFSVMVFAFSACSNDDDDYWNKDGEFLFKFAGDVSADEGFKAGETREFQLSISGVQEISISKPEGWTASINKDILKITAPETATDGMVSLKVIGNDTTTNISMKVSTYNEIRYLTFEDGDYVGGSNFVGSSDWSSLIDDVEYGGTLLYGASGWGPTSYYWYDQNNTFIKSEFPTNWGTTSFSGGGQAISNYVELSLNDIDYKRQLSVYYKDSNTGFGGHNGSKNFCVNYGYTDNSAYSAEKLPYFYFGDNGLRTIDHMYVTNTTFAMTSYINANSLTSKIEDTDYVKVIAIGYNLSNVETGRTEIYLVNGPQNIISEWTKWDLSGLGKVNKVEFNITGSSDNGLGFSQPAYFAFDDVAVRF